MKKKIFNFIGICSIALAGVATLAGVLIKKDTQIVNAESETIDVYFENVNDWNGTIYCHHWGGNTKGTEWRGDKMTYIYKSEYNHAVYKVTIPSDREGIIFNSDWDIQTNDITEIANDKCYYVADNQKGYDSYDMAHYNVNYATKKGTGTMDSQTVYTYNPEPFTIKECEFKRTGYKLVSWDTTVAGKSYSYKPGDYVESDTFSSDVTLTATWDGKDGYYLTGLFGECSYSIDGSIELEYVNNQYEGTIILKSGNLFHVSLWETQSLKTSYGYDELSNVCGGRKYFGKSGSWIYCNAAGEYNVYFDPSGWGEGKYLSIEPTSIKTAEQLAVKIMDYDVSEGNKGYCADRFPECKSIYLNLPESEQTIFRGFVNESGVSTFYKGYMRYTSWATALGEKPWEAGKVNNSPLIYNLINSDASDSSVVIIILLLTSSLTLTGLVIYKKHKQN